MEGPGVYGVSALAIRKQGAAVWTNVPEEFGVLCRRLVYGSTKKRRSRSLWEQVQADAVRSFTLQRKPHFRVKRGPASGVKIQTPFQQDRGTVLDGRTLGQ